MQLLCYVRCIQSPLNLLEEGFAGRRKICNQLLQGIDEQEITHDLVDRAVQQQRRKPSPLPPFLSTFPCKNLTAIKISFKSHGSAVFLLNRSGQRLIGYSSGPQSPKGSQGVVMAHFFLILLEGSTTEAEIRAVAM
ncbi:hypothetical protein BFW41_09145 [Aeromonas hydrophila]|uniref:hypothetical protein n=1 Tax=Aeromonas TaxID=642 RepID=UPI000E58528E|nr:MULTISPECIES: hypothetical protein [Aeromonas]AXV34081.1 hypothetical protein BFW41_09145 [Aeromonas hydrophila]MCX4114289.1 hypothetical protein [Aeromonas hydrophila]